MENNKQQAQSSSYPPQPPFQHLLQQQQHQLQMFWTFQQQEIEQVNDFKNQHLPLARIKKIMKADEDVRMISAEAPILFAKACELFILELTIRSWFHAEENKRRTLQKNDIGAAVTRADIFDFLVDIVPKVEIKDEAGLGLVEIHGMDQGVHIHTPSQAWQSVWQTTDDGLYGSGNSGRANLDGHGYVGYPLIPSRKRI